ncbi:HLH-domain-containing protein [Ceratobasidium sp. AG-I]|nr:HLH-domain-containing protein [Ceratobasidium sp. AG-I]
MLALPPRRRPAPAYDPSMYFAHNNFGSPFDAFSARLKYSPDHAPNVDFADTLASMISESDARSAANGTPSNAHHHPTYHNQPQPNPFDPHQFPHAASNHPILSPTGSAFSPGGHHTHHGHHYPAPASAPATSHPSFFDSAAHDYAFLRGPPTDRADTPSLASPTADSPFSQTASTVATAPSKRGSRSGASRSRSRGPAAASTSRSRARKRLSVSSPSPPPSASSSVLIPSQNAWYIPTHGGHADNGSFGFALGSHGTPSSLTMPMAGASPKSLTAKVAMAEDIATKQAQLLSEKRRRRRESHNAVERRRRDNINEKISELSTLIPECLLTDAPTPATGKDDVLGPVDEEGGKEGPKANKGMILRKSVDYIKYLQQLVRAQASRNRELESQLSQYRGPDEPASDVAALLGLGSIPGVIDSVGHVDFDKLIPIQDEDGEDMEMSPGAVPFSSEISSQILATLEASQDRAPTLGSNTVESPSVDGMDEEDEDASIGDESERGRQSMRRGRFGYPSQSVGKSAKVEEVDESALSDASGKMED